MAASSRIEVERVGYSSSAQIRYKNIPKGIRKWIESGCKGFKSGKSAKLSMKYKLFAAWVRSGREARTFPLGVVRMGEEGPAVTALAEQCACLHHVGGGEWVGQEDNSRIYSDEAGVVSIVADGHGDKGMVSRSLCEFLPEALLNSTIKAPTKRIKRSLRPVQKACEEAHLRQVEAERAQATEEEREPYPIWGRGSCLLLSWIDGNLLRTANVGDSEAFVYRKVEDAIIEIPLSYVATWMDQPDRKRFIKEAGREPEHKKDRPTKDGINCPRTLGDIPDRRYLSYVADVTEFALLPGDFLLQVCDGPIDFPPIGSDGKEISFLTIVTEFWGDPKAVAHAVIEGCLRNKSLADNLSVTAMIVTELTAPRPKFDLWAAEPS